MTVEEFDTAVEKDQGVCTACFSLQDAVGYGKAARCLSCTANRRMSVRNVQELYDNGHISIKTDLTLDPMIGWVPSEDQKKPKRKELED
jgi:hypothetical protein